ncbi:uncharacterized protein LOC132567334 [Heteronotia binoei]|uniref:uncharacterized protein LOC132567334 n=1 Tax=Heteronotia binoei TaxID=13085 RepID=UPI0029305D4C|nr:uncharacterized protein LOC132567334 [Heteronotia binoei]
MRRRTLPEVPTEAEEEAGSGEPPTTTAAAPILPPPAEANQPPEPALQPTDAPAPGETPEAKATPAPQATPRRSTRERRPPAYLRDYRPRSLQIAPLTPPQPHVGIRGRAVLPLLTHPSPPHPLRQRNWLRPPCLAGGIRTRIQNKHTFKNHQLPELLPSP